MRTIKFKAKRKCKEQWVSGDLAHSLDGKLNILGFVEEEGKIGFTGAHPIDPITVCQFTGFHDKNGKEVYEGDVLRSDIYPFSCTEDNKYDNYYGAIGWSEEDASFYIVAIKNPKSSVRGISDGICDTISQKKMQDFEVLGNIHDPEWKQYCEYFQEEDKEESDD
jgi:uncharacterized phage protein (TIGR01671 family)